MKLLFFQLFLLPLAFGAETFISISYYDGLGQKFRVERAVSYKDCEEKTAARKIFLDETNELREFFLLGPDGRIIDEAKILSDMAGYRARVEAVFAGASQGESPCLKKAETKTESSSPSATPQ